MLFLIPFQQYITRSKIPNILVAKQTKETKETKETNLQSFNSVIVDYVGQRIIADLNCGSLAYFLY
jgi:hypothetical protein